jgi:methyl-accepting chemotaxis protein
VWKNRSFKAKVLLVIIPFITLGLIALSILAYRQFYNVIEQEMSKSVLANTEEVSQTINTWLTGRVLEVSMAAASPPAQQVNTDGESTFQLSLSRISNYQRQHTDESTLNAFAVARDGSAIVAVPDNGQFAKKAVNVEDFDYYKHVMAGKGAYITDPVFAKSLGKVTVAVAAPILDGNNQPVGIIGSAMSTENITKKIKEIGFGEKGYGILVSRTGVYVVHPDSEKEQKKKITEEDIPALRELGQLMLEGKSGIYPFTQNGEELIAFYHPIPIANWSVASIVYKDELFAPAYALLKYMGIFAAGMIIVLSLVVFWFLSRTVAPLTRLSDFAGQVAAGDLTGSITIDSGDEIGRLAGALNNTVKHLRNIVSGINTTSQHVIDSTSQLADSCQAVNGMADSVAKAIAEVATGATSQAADVGKAVVSTQEFTKTSEDMSKQCGQVMDSAKECQRVSLIGADSINQAVKSMETIVSNNQENIKESRQLIERSSQIGNIIEVITGIANQTNLLALNAAIEAARAGEQGKGFAVVAEEVRKLAEQSGNAAQQIADLIHGIQEEINNITASMDRGSQEIEAGVHTAKQAGLHFGDIEKAVRAILTAVEETNQSVQKVNQEAGGTVLTMQNVSAVTEQTSAATEEVSAAVEEQTETINQIAATSQNLLKLVKELHEQVVKFKV